MAQIRHLRAFTQLPGVGDARVVHGQGVTFGECGHGASDAGNARSIASPDCRRVRTCDEQVRLNRTQSRPIGLGWTHAARVPMP